MKKNKGFTLIELLVVITLIAILSGVILSVINIGGIRQKTRDARRAADLRKVQTALELYFAQNREYPVSATWEVLSNASPGYVASKIKGSYIAVIPTDPSTAVGANPCTSTNLGYWYIGSAGKYVIAANMEVTTSASASLCSALNGWGSFTTGCVTPPTSCYGVENPF
jgi:prepilin-type N-terminal cleavage/methylation domain-containing protein